MLQKGIMFLIILTIIDDFQDLDNTV